MVNWKSQEDFYPSDHRESKDSSPVPVLHSPLCTRAFHHSLAINGSKLFLETAGCITTIPILELGTRQPERGAGIRVLVSTW